MLKGSPKTMTVSVVDGYRLLSLVLFLRVRCIDDNHNHSYGPNYNTRCSWEWLRWLYFTFFGSILFIVPMWHWERTSRAKHGRGSVGGNWS